MTPTSQRMKNRREKEIPKSVTQWNNIDFFSLSFKTQIAKGLQCLLFYIDYLTYKI